MGVQFSAPSLRVLGVDPGTLHTGWGVIERKGRTLEFRAAGVISTRGFHSLPERLRVIYTGLVDVIHDWEPQVLSLEKAFLAYNVQSALRLGEARGVALLAATQAGLRIAEYNPTEIKTAVVGYGRAEKSQVQKAVFAFLGSKVAETLGPPVSQDATDALAAAICHLNTSRLSERIQEVGGQGKVLRYKGQGQRRSLRNVLAKSTVAQLLASAKGRGKA
ncbi:MAG: crossover junction endodeoxyribonuclease RuvC [Deltaproteobacteria bacterium]|nr:crossover junction endodeoxyribonuclease RuvC [Deltaproteobacteria bacterium]